MSKGTQILWWVLRHPWQTFKIFFCTHRDVNLDTLKCNWCGKQFRYFAASDYVNQLTGREEEQ